MAGSATKLGTAAVLVVLAGGIWAGVRPKPDAAVTEAIDATATQTKPAGDGAARHTTIESPPAAAMPTALPRTVAVASELPSATGQRSDWPLPDAAAPPVRQPAAAKFADRRDLVERPVTAFVDQRPLADTKAEPVFVAPERPAIPVKRFEDHRHLTDDKPAPSAPAPASGSGEQPIATARLDGASGCGPVTVETEPLDGGRMIVRLASACRAGRSLSLAYGGAVLARRLDAAGRLEFTLDLFAGPAPLSLTLHDGARQTIATRARDLDRVDKVAIIWQTPVDLDLHAFEYGARSGEPGHVSPLQPSAAVAARELTLASGRGRGFLSRTDTGEGLGDKVEVYTHFRAEGTSPGPVQLMIDYVTRGALPTGAHCGTGANARVLFESVTLSQGQVERRSGEIPARPCGRPLDSASRMTPLPQQTVRR